MWNSNSKLNQCRPNCTVKTFIWWNYHQNPIKYHKMVCVYCLNLLNVFSSFLNKIKTQQTLIFILLSHICCVICCVVCRVIGWLACHPPAQPWPRRTCKEGPAMCQIRRVQVPKDTMVTIVTCGARSGEWEEDGWGQFLRIVSRVCEACNSRVTGLSGQRVKFHEWRRELSTWGFVRSWDLMGLWGHDFHTRWLYY